MNAETFIQQLSMQQHPEGGYFSSAYASETVICDGSIRVDFRDDRLLWTSIYFLLKEGEKSHFHRLKSDEMWYFHAGSPLTVHVIHPDGSYSTEKLGLDVANGEKPQVLVKKGTIFGSSMNEDGFSLVGCMVSPGFDFADFELFERSELLADYPQHEQIIHYLTRDVD